MRKLCLFYVSLKSFTTIKKVIYSKPFIFFIYCQQIWNGKTFDINSSCDTQPNYQITSRFQSIYQYINIPCSRQHRKKISIQGWLSPRPAAEKKPAVSFESKSKSISISVYLYRQVRVFSGDVEIFHSPSSPTVSLTLLSLQTSWAHRAHFRYYSRIWLTNWHCKP